MNLYHKAKKVGQRFKKIHVSPWEEHVSTFPENIGAEGCISVISFDVPDAGAYQIIVHPKGQVVAVFVAYISWWNMYPRNNEGKRIQAWMTDLVETLYFKLDRPEEYDILMSQGQRLGWLKRTFWFPIKHRFNRWIDE